MRVTTLPPSKDHWFRTRHGVDAYGNAEVYVLTRIGCLVFNFEDIADPDTHWFFLGVFDRHDASNLLLLDPAAVYCKGWTQQVWLEPSSVEMSKTNELLSRRHHIPDAVVESRHKETRNLRNNQ